jgi:phosphotransferase system enzyme I (PtsP)
MCLSTDLGQAQRAMTSLLGLSAGSIRNEIESLARKLNVVL